MDVDVMTFGYEATGIPAEIAVIYAWTKLLPLRNVRLFWCANLGFSILVILIRALVGSDVVAGSYTAIAVINYLVLPLFLSEGRILPRFAACVAVCVAVVVSEIVGHALWVVIVGPPTAGYQAVCLGLPAFWFIRLVHLLLLAMLLVAIMRLFERHLNVEIGRGLGMFLGFGFSQLLLLIILASVGGSLSGGSLAAAESAALLYGGGAVLSAMCIAIDSFLFVWVGMYESRVVEEKRVEFLRAQLEWRLNRYGEMTRDMERAARVRHDLSNQLQVASMLVERGEHKAAAEHIRSMVRLIEGDSGKGGDRDG